MKVTYTGLDGKQYTAQWIAHPLGHLRICKLGSNHAIKQSLMSEEDANAWFETIKLPRNKYRLGL